MIMEDIHLGSSTGTHTVSHSSSETGMRASSIQTNPSLQIEALSLLHHRPCDNPAAVPSTAASFADPPPALAPAQPRHHRGRVGSKASAPDLTLPAQYRFSRSDWRVVHLYSKWRAGVRGDMLGGNAERHIAELLKRVLARPPSLGGPERYDGLQSPYDTGGWGGDDEEDIGLIWENWPPEDVYDPPDFLDYALGEDGSDDAVLRQRALLAEGWPQGALPSLSALRGHMIDRANRIIAEDMRTLGHLRPDYKTERTEEARLFEVQQAAPSVFGRKRVLDVPGDSYNDFDDSDGLDDFDKIDHDE